MSSYIIRKITDLEYDRLYELIVEFATFISSPDNVKTSAYQLAKEATNYECLVVDIECEIIGYAIYYFAYSSWSGKLLYLEDLYIQAAYRNQGIGSELFDQVFQQSKLNSCKKMKWQVSNWNDHAISFYTSKGAIIDNTEVNCELWT